MRITPPALAAASLARLSALADPAVAARARSFFKDDERVAFYGVSAKALRSLERELFVKVEDLWSAPEALRYAERMLAEPLLEARGLGLLLLARFVAELPPAFLATARSWLAAGRCANWATTDTLCVMVLAPFLRRSPTLVPRLAGWSRARNLWVRRASAVALVPLARHGDALEAAYGVAESLLRDQRDLVHKATGWLLREAGKTDPGRLERFLLARGAGMPRTALRYAIERLPPAKRRLLLSRTRRPTARTPAGRELRSNEG